MLFNFFSYLQNFLKNDVYTHPFDLSCHQKFEKNRWPEAEILVHEVRKYEKVTIDYIRLYACAKLFTHAQSSSHACETTGLPSGRILCEKETFFLSIVLRVTRKVTKTNLGEFYRSHLHLIACQKIYLFFSSFSSCLFLCLWLIFILHSDWKEFYDESPFFLFTRRQQL